MDTDKLELYKDLLTQKIEQILGTTGKTLDEMTDTVNNFPDPIDRATSESSSSVELRTRDRERKLLQKIHKALQKIMDRTYGECEECGELISSERLKARPEAVLCINCKEEQEQMEKRFGS